MKSAYDQIEESILPALNVWALGSRMKSRRILRICLERAPLESLPANDKAQNQPSLQLTRQRWSDDVRAVYEARYGISIIWVALLSAIIKVAIDLILEWWFRGDKRDTIKEAVRILRQSNREGTNVVGSATNG